MDTSKIDARSLGMGSGSGDLAGKASAISNLKNQSRTGFAQETTKLSRVTVFSLLR